MDSLWAALVAAVGLLGVLLWVAWRRKAPASKGRRSTDALDTLSAWQPQATRVLTRPEQLAMMVLTRAVPDYIVLAQVPLARFIRVPGRYSYAEWLRRVGQLSPDLLVCDTTSQIVAAVEISKSAGKLTARAEARLERMRRVLKAAGIPLHVWVEGQLPTPEKAREALLPNAVAAEQARLTAAAAADAAEVIAVAGSKSVASRMLEPLDEDAEPDEVIEMREPPPSTWFDPDFETRNGMIPEQRKPGAKPPGKTRR